MTGRPSTRGMRRPALVRAAPLALAAALTLLAVAARPASAAPKVKDVLALVPDDVTLIAAADVAGARGATTMASISPDVMMRSGPLHDLLGTGGASVIDRYVAAKVGTPAYTWAGTIFIADGTFPADLLSSAPYTALRTERGYAVYTLSHGGASFDATLKGGRLMIAEGAQLTRVLDVATRSKAKGAARSAATSKAAATLRAALASADTTATAWAAAVVSGAVASTLAQASLPASWLSVSIDVGGSLRLSTVVELGDAKLAASAAASATSAASTLSSSLGSGTGAVSLATFTAVAAGTTLRLSIAISDSDLQATLPLLRTAIP
jgi:hypothetical protein